MASGNTTDGPQEQSLFFAYARRTDHRDFSRYMLTFSSRAICEEWWQLVQQTYPDTQRANPQLFSFTGDGRPGIIWNNARFQHLKTKWIFSQFGDAQDTRGGAQQIIPVQTGSYAGYGGSMGGAVGGAAAGAGQAQAEGGGVDMKELAAMFEKAVGNMAEQNEKQLKSISELQRNSTDNLEKQLSKLAEQSNAQLQSMAEAQQKATDDFTRLQGIVEQNSNQHKEMLEAQKSQPSQVSQGSTQQHHVSSDDIEGLQKIVEQQNVQIAALTAKLGDVVNVLQEHGSAGSEHSLDFGQCKVCGVKPPPRKLNRRVTGYTYSGKVNDGGA